MRWSGICVLLFLCGALGLLAQTPEAWDVAARSIRRLPPDSFPQLPPAVRSALTARGCSVPQSFTSKRPHNVVAGSFFWGGSEAGAPAEFTRASDAAFLQGIGEGRIGYSRVLAAASPAQMREYAVAFGGALPQVLDHDGVEDAFAGTGSVVSYLEAGRWLALTGAD